MDRQVLGVLKTTLQHDLGWNEIDYGNLVFAFQTAYAVGLLVVGAAGGSSGHSFGLRVGDGVLEPGFHGARAGKFLHQLSDCPIRVGFR